MSGQIGLEKTPEEYVAKIVAVFREVKRVLRDDGTLWLNLGDSYCGGNTGNQSNVGQRYGKDGEAHIFRRDGAFAARIGLKPKDLVGIPWRVAFALQADGWYLRSDIVWHKPNPMPESVTDRPTKSHEYVFLLSKSADYFYDQEAIREPVLQSSKDRASYGYAPSGREKNSVEAHHGKGFMRNNGEAVEFNSVGRNKRTVWTIATAPYSEAHFATYPPDLVKPCILAGTSARGCCPKCGAPWERIVKREKIPDAVLTGTSNPCDEFVRGNRRDGGKRHGSGQKMQDWLNEHPTQTIGWRPTCQHGEWYCATCCTVLEYEHVILNREVCSSTVSELRSSVPTGQTGAVVLQSPVLSGPSSQNSNSQKGLHLLQTGIPAKIPQNQVLLETMRTAMDGEAPLNNQGLCDRSQGIQTDLPTITPNGVKDGVCNGASANNGQDDRTKSARDRGCPPQERGQGGQPAGKPAIGNETGSRPKAKGDLVCEVSTLRSKIPIKGQCPHCKNLLVFRPFQPIPATVLDPFFGSGTTGMVALELGRNAVGCELSPEYVKLIRQRTAVTPGLAL